MSLSFVKNGLCSVAAVLVTASAFAQIQGQAPQLSLNSGLLTITGVVQQVKGVNTAQDLMAAGIYPTAETATAAADTVDALITYIPDPKLYNYSPVVADLLNVIANAPKQTLGSKILSECIFESDSTRINGPLEIKRVTVKLAKDGSYSLAFPVSGARGSCQYVIGQVDLDVTYGKVLEDLTLHSQAWEDEMQMGYPRLPKKSTRKCEFAISDSAGLCTGETTYITDFKSQTVIMNFKATKSIY